MSRLRYNNQQGILGAILGSGGTTITFQVIPSFATLVAPDYIVLVLEPGTINEEIVYLTAYTSGQLTGTVVRNQEGSPSSLTHALATTWQHGPTSADFWTRNVIVQAANYTAKNGDVVLANATSGAIALTLPAVAANLQVIVKKTDNSANKVTVTPQSGTIDGAANFVIWGQYHSITFVSDGTNWFVTETRIMDGNGNVAAGSYTASVGPYTADAEAAAADGISTLWLNREIIVARPNGSDDTTDLTSALTAAVAKPGTPVKLQPTLAATPYSLAASLPAINYGVSVLGPGSGLCVVKPTAAVTGDVFRIKGSPFVSLSRGGKFGGFALDGASATAGACGMHLGDMGAIQLDDILMKNWSGVGSKGFWVDNQTNWTERLQARHISLDNNTIGVLFDSNGGTNSVGYQDWDATVTLNAGQVGFQLQNGVHLYNSRLVVRGNAGGSGMKVISLLDTSLFSGEVDIVVETASASGALGLSTAVGTSWTSQYGAIDFSNGTLSSSVLGTFKHGGYLSAPGIHTVTGNGFTGITQDGSAALALDTLAPTSKRVLLVFQALGTDQFWMMQDRNGNGTQDIGLYDRVNNVLRWYTDSDGSFHFGLPNHVITNGTGTPATSNLGVNITSVTFTGNDRRGRIVIVVGAGGLAANTRVATCTWATTFGSVTPLPLLVNQTNFSGIANVNWYSGNESATAFDLFCNQALVATTYQIRYNNEG